MNKIDISEGGKHLKCIIHPQIHPASARTKSQISVSVTYTPSCL